MAVQTGTLEPETKAVRSGKSSSITAMTTRIEKSRSRRNDITDLLTTWGWLVILCISTSGGNVCLHLAISCSTFLPKATMLLPGAISMEISTVEPPLYLI